MKNNELSEKVAGTIEKHGLLSEGDSVIAGFSGGPDSACLVTVLAELKERYSLSIHAVYINHNLRPDEVGAEIAFCRCLSEELGIGFSVMSIDVLSYCSEMRMNRQEAARHLRYDALQEAAREMNAGKIALAHTADDQAETFFMRIARGAGPSGLSGIPIMRGNIIRPLLEVERSEIEAFLRAKCITPAIDSSNLKTDYFRNMIRLKLMPILKQSNPAMVRTICSTMEILNEEERYFDIQVTKTLMKLISRKSEKRIELFLSPMESMDRVILRRVLRRAIGETNSLRSIGFRHIEDISELIRHGRSGDRLMLPGGIRIIKEYALLVMTTEPPVRLAEYELKIPGEAVLAGSGIVLRAEYAETPDAAKSRDSVVLDAETMSLPLRVRSRKAGDFFYPAGFGKRKKLQDFFVDMKIPRDERERVPIVCSGGDIVWIAGQRADERFRTTDRTKKFVRLAIVKGKF
jgi:tRNA(Ile)-lysidine synthase